MKFALVLVVFFGNPIAAHGDYFEAHQLLEMLKSDDPSMARGYVAGLQDAFNGITFCVPPPVKLSQAAAIVREYLEENPEVWHDKLTSSVTTALAGAFPCGK